MRHLQVGLVYFITVTDVIVHCTVRRQSPCESLKVKGHAFGFSRSTHSWQSWHFCITSKENKLEVVTNGINFTANLHLS